MVGMRFKAFSTAEDWSLPDRLRGRISVHRGAAQWLHFLRYSSATCETGLTGSPSRPVMTVPQSGPARQAERRVGQACVRSCSSGWAAVELKQSVHITLI